jgi:hypothetical protein
MLSGFWRMTCGAACGTNRSYPRDVQRVRRQRVRIGTCDMSESIISSCNSGLVDGITVNDSTDRSPCGARSVALRVSVDVVLDNKTQRREHGAYDVKLKKVGRGP